MPSILVVEDEPDAANLLAIHLRKAGHEVTVAGDGGKGLTCARTIRPDLILLDQMLPTMSGTEVCRVLKSDPATADIAIIMLTARAAEADRIKGFEHGADDYVTKPFSMKELLLRIEARLRRRDPSEIEGQKLIAGPLTLDLMNQRLSIGEKEVRLTATESRLLATLAVEPGRVVSRADLLREVWQYGSGADTRTVDTHVRRLRAKLGGAATLLQTFRGVGYRLHLSGSESDSISSE